MFVRCDLLWAKLGEAEGREVYEGQRALSDPNWDGNHNQILENWSATRGKSLAIVPDGVGKFSTESVVGTGSFRA
jgi:hypothetical protein